MAELYNQEIFKDEHIVVTGGGTGLGRAMAMRFASLGAKVTICGRREEPLLETAKEIVDCGRQSGRNFLQYQRSRSGRSDDCRSGIASGKRHKISK